jgi:alpha-glucosidase
MRELVKQLWQNIVFSQDEVEYQQRLNEFEQACAGSSKLVDYVKDTWLNPHRQRFVEAWTNQVLHLGNTTTNDYAYFTKMYFV